MRTIATLARLSPRTTQLEAVAMKIEAIPE
jgi:hypothetical protein